MKKPRRDEIVKLIREMIGLSPGGSYFTRKELVEVFVFLNDIQAVRESLKKQLFELRGELKNDNNDRTPKPPIG